jgi:hypothetical protein
LNQSTQAGAAAPHSVSLLHSALVLIAIVVADTGRLTDPDSFERAFP